MAIHNRRLVAGLNADGRSCVLFDGSMAEVPNDHPFIAMVWRTDTVPARNEGAAESCGIPITLDRLSDGGSYFLLFEIGAFDSPVMHVTDTIDYVVVLHGAFLFRVETQDVILKPGDLLIDRGVNHGWSAVGEAPALLAAAMLPARPLNALPRSFEPLNAPAPPGPGTHPRNRRVVTGLDPQGRSCILLDSGTDALPLLQPGEALVWQTDTTPADNSAMADICHADACTDSGSSFVLIEIGPGEVREPRATNSVDYGVVLTGKVRLTLEMDDVLLKPGDLIIICGAKHGWCAAGEEAALIALVRVPADPLQPKPPAIPSFARSDNS